MSYRWPVLRPVTCSTRKESSSTPCSGEPRSPRTSGLLILVRVAGGTDRFTVLVIAQHLLPTSLPGAGRRARGLSHLRAGPVGWPLALRHEARCCLLGGRGQQRLDIEGGVAAV